MTLDEILEHTRCYYILGGTGTGKTTLIGKMGEKLKDDHAVIILDAKGDDAKRLAEKYDGKLIDVTNEAINPFELTSHTAENRDLRIDQHINANLGIIQAMLDYQRDYVLFYRCVAAAFTYLYQNSNNPLFTDFYKVVRMIAGQISIDQIEKEFGKIPSDIKDSFDLVAQHNMPQIEGMLNRLDRFNISSGFTKMFCNETTLDIEEMLKPGSFTVIKFAEGMIPRTSITILLKTLLLKLWTIVQIAKSEEKGNKVFLAIDEVQNLGNYELLSDMIAQSRNKGLSIAFAHQNLDQIDDQDFNDARHNSMKIIGIVSDEHSSKLAKECRQDDLSVFTKTAPYCWKVFGRKLDTTLEDLTLNL